MKKKGKRKLFDCESSDFEDYDTDNENFLENAVSKVRKPIVRDINPLEQILQWRNDIQIPTEAQPEKYKLVINPNPLEED